MQAASASLWQAKTVASFTQVNEWKLFYCRKLIRTAPLLSNKCLTHGVEAENIALAHKYKQELVVLGIWILQSTDGIARQEGNHGFGYGNLLVDLTIKCVPEADQVIDAPRH